MLETLVSAISLKPVNILQLIFAFVSLYACLLFWSDKRFRGICMILVIEASLMLLNFSEETRLFQQTWLITPIFTFLHGPAFYLFIKNLVYAGHRWQKHESLHFLPALLALPFTDHTQIVLAIGSLNIVFYGLASFQLLMRYQKAIYTMQSDPEALNLRWLVYFMAAFALVAIQDIVRINSQPYMEYVFRNVWYLADISLFFSLFLALIYLGLKQPDLFNQLEYYEVHLAPTASTESPPETMDKTLEKSLFVEIDNIVQSKQLYLQPRLSLLDLAEETGINVKEISSAINTGSAGNFSEYINGLRLNVALKKLRANAKGDLTILQIALDCGFNSKSTFNHYFRSQMKMTPGQFLKEQT